MSIYFIKIIALISMLLDHINKTFHLNIDLLTFIGRISFPLFAFSFAEGCHKTKNAKRRIARLAIFALLSEPCYNFALDIKNWIRVLHGTETICFFTSARLKNIIVTYLISVLIITLGRTYHHKFFLKSIIFIACLFLAEMLHSDYGAWGILLIISLYFCSNKKQCAFLTFIWCTLFYLGYASWNGFSLMWFGPHASFFYLYQWIFSCMSIPFILFYNEKAGKKHTVGFYLFYPLHLLTLALIRELIY